MPLKNRKKFELIKNMDLQSVKKLKLPKKTGCYFFKDKDGHLIYVGKASSLASRVSSYWQKSASLTPAKNELIKKTKVIDWVETDSEIEALLLEANLIKKHQPIFNIDLRDDKRFSYIKISLADEIPGVFITRKIDKSGKYFGPFTGALAARETLKTIRKIWPYCAERKQKTKPCFYYQINKCPGVCVGKISSKNYMELAIKPIILFLSGKKNKLIANYQLQINNYKKEIRKLKPESEGYFKLEKLIKQSEFRLANMKNVLEHAKIIGLSEKYAADTVELAKTIALPSVPSRIEGYDISNIFGQEAVGSMVVFKNGEPAKNEYKKFKIKINQGLANDIGMLKEVLERRLKHTEPCPAPPLKKGKENEPPLFDKEGNGGSLAWPRPDLIIVDGGKGQLNAALGVLKKFKFNLPVIAVSKGQGRRSGSAPDKIFFPGEKTPLILPLASPALHIIKRVRDEAHRFAISYHRKIKNKNLFK